MSLVQVCPAIVPQFFTTWALHAQYATHAHAFLLGFFVTVENKRLVNPTPKRKVARWNRAGGTSFPKEIRTSPPSNAVCPAICPAISCGVCGTSREYVPEATLKNFSSSTSKRRHLKAMIIAAIDTGCRQGELRRLRWSDVNLQANTLRVTSYKGKTVNRRVVPITDRLRAALLDLRTKPSVAAFRLKTGRDTR